MSVTFQNSEYLCAVAHDLGVRSARNAACGLVTRDEAYREMKQRIEGIAPYDSDPRMFLPSRRWLESTIDRLALSDHPIRLPGAR